MEFSLGDGKPTNYIGLMDEILEESRHWGDFDSKVVSEWIADEDTGETYSMDFLLENKDMFEDK